MIEPGLHAGFVMALAALAFTLFVRERIQVETVCLGVLVLLSLGFALAPLDGPDGPIDPLRFLTGFSHPAVIAICALMMLGHALVITGALEPLARRLASRIASHPVLAMLATLVGAMLASATMNDTPVVVLLIPVLLSAARRARRSAAGMLMPANFAVLIGGMSTTIGTSTNLIVVGIAASLGMAPLGMFAYFDLVMLAAIPGVLYLWLLAPRLLAHVQVPEERLSDDVFEAELVVEAGSWLDGREFREVLRTVDGHVQVPVIRRQDGMVARLPTMRMKTGDRLLLRGTAVNLKEAEATLHASLHAVDEARTGDRDGSGSDVLHPLPSEVVAQLIIGNDSPLALSTVRQERLAERYGFVVVGLRPRAQVGGWQRTELVDRTIAAGDILLVQGDEAAMRKAQDDSIGLLLDERFTSPRQHKAALALAVMGAVVLLVATKVLPIAVSALLGVALLIATRCMSWREATQALSVKVLLLVVSSLALGDALHVTGATHWMAGGLAVALDDLPMAAVIALLMGVMGLATNFVSNNATAAIGTPIGIALAGTLGAPVEPFVLAVLFGCNLCYLTPMGYQTNLLVMNAGGYRFADFVRVGLPLFVIMWLTLTWLLVARYGLA